ncbi:MAG: hypothetical protein WCR23_07860 [Planctomycetota bacterium]|nr:hypothetical protein [Planctomycetia bacterium]
MPLVEGSRGNLSDECHRLICHNESIPIAIAIESKPSVPQACSSVPVIPIGIGKGCQTNNHP